MKQDETKTYRGMGIQLRKFLAFAVHSGEKSVSLPGRFDLWERTFGLNGKGSCADLRSDFDALDDGRMSYRARN
jgi:hypothetical protein